MSIRASLDVYDIICSRKSARVVASKLAEIAFLYMYENLDVDYLVNTILMMIRIVILVI